MNKLIVNLYKTDFSNDRVWIDLCEALGLSGNSTMVSIQVDRAADFDLSDMDDYEDENYEI